MVMHPRAGNCTAATAFELHRIAYPGYSLFAFLYATLSFRGYHGATTASSDQQTERIEKSGVMSSKGETEKQREKEGEIGRRISRRARTNSWCETLDDEDSSRKLSITEQIIIEMFIILITMISDVTQSSISLFRDTSVA